MASLTYNGVTLTNLKTNIWEREAIKDGDVNYLYTAHTIRVKGIYNPRMISYKPFQPALGTVFPPGTGVPVTPTAVPGQVAPVTDEAIRHVLMQQRQKLIYHSGEPNPAGNDMLVSPPVLPALLGTATVDSAQGPDPVYCNVREIIGTKTFEVEFVIRTYLNESYLYTTDPPTILSHLWRMEHDVNSQYLAVRRVFGRAIFDTAVLSLIPPAFGFGVPAPDDWRQFLFHPIPDHFKRENIQVTAEEDGTALVYSFEDVEQEYVLLTGTGPGGPNATKIESAHTARLFRPGLESIVGMEASQLLGKAQQLLDKTIGGHVTDVLDPRNWAIGGGIIGTERIKEITGRTPDPPSFLDKLAFLPTVQHEVVVRVWGNRSAFRQDLQGVAAQVISNRLSGYVAAGGILSMADWHCDITHNLLANFVEVSAGFKTAPLTTVLLNGVGGGLIGPMPGFIAAQALWPLMPTNDFVTGITGFLGAAPAPQGDTVSTGSYIAQCVANVLAQPSMLYASPTNELPGEARRE